MPSSTYEEFLREIQPHVIGLRSCRAELDWEQFWNARSGELKEQRVLGATFNLGNVDDGHFDVVGDFTVALRGGEESKAREDVPLLAITCSFWAHFHTEHPVNREHADRFAHGEARLVFMPYLRQFVADITSRMSIPPVLIPLAVTNPLRTAKQLKSEQPEGASHSRSPRKRKAAKE